MHPHTHTHTHTHWPTLTYEFLKLAIQRRDVITIKLLELITDKYFNDYVFHPGH